MIQSYRQVLKRTERGYQVESAQELGLWKLEIKRENTRKKNRDNKSKITQLYEEQLGISQEGNKKEELQRETGRGAGTRSWKEN